VKSLSGNYCNRCPGITGNGVPEFAKPAQLSSDGGLLVMRELDDVLGLSDLASGALNDNRRGKNTVHRLDGLFRQSVYGRLAGYEDVNDADRLALDPVMR
jgi:hypothetical protein